MQNISLEIKKSSKASAFTLIVAFVCVALVGACAVASGQTEPLTDITRLHGAFQYARHFGTRGGNDSYQQTGGDACPRERDSGYLFYFRKRVGQYQRESG